MSKRNILMTKRLEALHDNTACKCKTTFISNQVAKISFLMSDDFKFVKKVSPEKSGKYCS